MLCGRWVFDGDFGEVRRAGQRLPAGLFVENILGLVCVSDMSMTVTAETSGDIPC